MSIEKGQAYTLERNYQLEVAWRKWKKEHNYEGWDCDFMVFLREKAYKAIMLERDESAE